MHFPKLHSGIIGQAIPGLHMRIIELGSTVTARQSTSYVTYLSKVRILTSRVGSPPR